MIKQNNLGVSSLCREQLQRLEVAIENTIFVIPSVNGGGLLERMIPTLGLPPHIIYVLDQGSTDSTQDICARFNVNIIQLGAPHTYTQCCNIALEIARERKSEFFYISNNDITFVTDVARELLHEIMNDSSLGALSCSQVVTDRQRSNPTLSNRVYWDLSKLAFEHDTSILDSEYYRIESDFCELTCTVLRMSAVSDIGGFDDDYGFYHEDADLGFRLRQAGYTTAYLPQSQIQHFAGSTFSRGLGQARLDYISKSKALFEKKHFGYGVSYEDFKSETPSSWAIINRNLFKNLKSMGMINDARPALTFAHPGERPFDYLYSVWETSTLPQAWLRFKDSYKAIFLPSQWNLETFRTAGFQNAHYVPLGVNTDTFHPWGEADRFYEETTFLWFSRNQHRKALDDLLEVWKIFHDRHPKSKLVIMGDGILTDADAPRSMMRFWREYLIYEDIQQGILFKETLKPLSEQQMAKIYRSVDCVISTSRSDGFGFNIVESLACGTMVIFPQYGAAADMVFPGALTFGGREIIADYSDKYFFEFVNWWEPCKEEILNAMEQFYGLSSADKSALIRTASNLVRSKFTWRTTSFAMRAALETCQTKIIDPYPAGKYSGRKIFESRLLEKIELNELDLLPISVLLRCEIDDIFADFDRNYYKMANSDLRNLLIDPLWHFLLFGWNENRIVGPAMSTAAFLSSHGKGRSFIIYLNDVGMNYDCQDLKWKFFDWQIKIVKQADRDLQLPNLRFIQLVYQTILGRDPDPEGLETFLSHLFNQKHSKEEVLEIIADSSEAHIKWRLDPIFAPPQPNESAVEADDPVEAETQKAMRAA